MPTNLLLLPLLGGFWFVHLCYLFRFRAQRLDGYRLLLESAFFGLLLIIPARGITYYWPQYSELGRKIQIGWGHLSSSAPFSGTATVSLLLGLLAPFLINWLQATCLRLKENSLWRFLVHPGKSVGEFLLPAKEWALSWSIKSSGNYLYQLLHKAVQDEVPILITLQSRKIYVGYVTESPNLKPDNQYLSLLPAISGHRDDKTLAVQRDLAYPDPDALFKNRGIDPRDLLVTVLLSEVKSASLYHHEMKDLFLPYEP
jgi:hypothetical protein